MKNNSIVILFSWLMAAVMSGCNPPGVAEDKLVWSDEFTRPGAPDSANWTYDIGYGSNGWGNNESQYYTDRPENARVENGLLVIDAVRSDSGWTSARLKTQGKHSWKYGRVVFRAKLPAGVGTWPALWMLGDDITHVGWPRCGEIDVMEHVGRNPAVVQSAMHTPSSHGNTVNKGETSVPTFDKDFHEYQVEWTQDSINFSVDGKRFYSYAPEVKNAESWPYDKPFFIIMNIAIGGNFGGTVSEDLRGARMEVDYVRVYQRE